jgi:predicted NUDIX family NTP pyrophosphohydrolase
MDRVYLAVDRDRWWSLVNAVTNIQVTKRRFSNFLNSSEIIDSHRGRGRLHELRQCDR